MLVTAPGYDNLRQRVRIAKGQQYDLIIYAHSVTGAMNARVVRVTIQ